jgi:hypothetical protein
MKSRPLVKCRACGHFGHQPGSRCPLRNLVPDDRPAAKARLELAKLFPGRPDLVAALEAMQESWVPKSERNGINIPRSFGGTESAVLRSESRRATSECSLALPPAGETVTPSQNNLPHLASRLAERWGARVRA